MRPEVAPLVEREDIHTALNRSFLVLGGLALGLFWPVTLPFRLLSRHVVAPTEQAERDRLELEKLRKLARDHGLPMPGGEGR